MISVEMRKLLVLAAIGALAVAAGAACGDDGGPAEPSGPTTILIQKAFARDANGGFTFTVQIANQGDNSAVQVALSDVWEGGLEVTSLGDLDGITANPIMDVGFEVLLDELKAGESKDIVYKATCSESGQWSNTAAVSAENADPESTSVSVSCP